MTCPLSDDVLLDWALQGGEADSAVDGHLRDCAPCRERSRAVLEEQALLRGAFAEPPSPSGLTRRVIPARAPRIWSRLGAAALLLAVVGLSGLILLTARTSARTSSRYRHSPLAPIQSDLGVMAQRIAAARGTLPEAEDPRTSAAYLALLASEETLYIEGMAHYLSERSPLSAEQEGDLRRTIQSFNARIWSRGEPAAASQEFRDKVRALLDAEQYLAFEEFSRQGMEWQWKTDLALLMDDLCGELDLRFSEAERVRRTLESNYPHAEFPVLRMDHCAPDALVENAALSGAVRNSLDTTYQRKFDTYLGHVWAARERAQKIIRKHRSPE
ncbi:MAG TPA: hypothetical protein VG457_09155 [Planctomycetota bacterium]|nr:hypothetical protein [Planctomycetota bacterium]